jgi:Zn-dependent protease
MPPGFGPWPPYAGAPAYPPSGSPPPPPPPPGYPASWVPPNLHGDWGASAYPTYAPDGKVDPELLRQTEPGRRSPGGGSGAAIGLGATVVAALTKLAVLAKFALPLLSALASFGVYAAIYGWQFGLGIVALLFVHEMGHVAVIRAKGLPASLPIFIPLMGALIFLRGMPHNARDEAEIAIGGPLAGALAGGACYVLYAQTGDRIWLAMAFFSFFINLFNLIPVSPLDGGRIVGAISKWIWPLGLVILAVALFYTHSIILLVVGWLGLLQTISRFRGGAALDAYYGVPLTTRVWITALYFGLAAVLALAILNLQPLLVSTGGFFGR